MAERSYDGRVLNTNPTMNGTGSAASVNNWIGASSQGWGLGQTTSGAATGEYTTYLGEDCIKVIVTGLTRSGGTIGQVSLQNLGLYVGTTVTPANLNIATTIVIPGRQYKLDARYFIESLSATTGGVRLQIGFIFYNSNGTRLQVSDDAESDTTVSTEWETQTQTVRAPINSKYAVIRCLSIPNADPTTDGAMTFYVSDLRATEVLPARTTATRTTATNRVAVRDMGTALRFGVATSDQVTVSNAANRVTSGGGDLTVALWVKPTKFGDFYAFAHPDSALANRTYIAVNTAGSVILNLGATGPSIPNKTRLNQWYHWCLVKDRTNSLAYFYINGVSAMSPYAYTPGSLSTPIDIFLGQQSLAGSKAWNGYIDEPRIWNRALTATEISNLYLYGQVPQDGLVAEYLFNEASGTTAIDSSGNGNDGTITGATYTLDVPLTERTSI